MKKNTINLLVLCDQPDLPGAIVYVAGSEPPIGVVVDHSGSFRIVDVPQGLLW